MKLSNKQRAKLRRRVAAWDNLPATEMLGTTTKRVRVDMAGTAAFHKPGSQNLRKR